MPLERQNLYVGPQTVAAGAEGLPSLFQGLEMVPNELKGGYQVDNFLTFNCLVVSTAERGGMGSLLQWLGCCILLVRVLGGLGGSTVSKPGLCFSSPCLLLLYRLMTISTVSVCAPSGRVHGVASTCRSPRWSAWPMRRPAN